MPEVISNTTPLQYLHQLGCLDFLAQFYQQIIVPQAVADELHQGELKRINVPLLHLHAWVTIEQVSVALLQRVPAGLHAGEREVMALALGKIDPLLILDDAAARAYAKTAGIRFTGTLGVLVKAKQVGLITAIRPCLDLLDKAGFYVAAAVRASILSIVGENP
jgi:predicted nucleic acid-binding protein